MYQRLNFFKKISICNIFFSYFLVIPAFNLNIRYFVIYEIIDKQNKDKTKNGGIMHIKI